ncbi:MAG: MBOAT family O-acyltransferase [Oscillospiraceae bacterium]
MLIFSAAVDYVHGLIIESQRGTVYAKLALISSLIINLGLLCTFKYTGFIIENINFLLGISLPPPTFSLPIGISFYTFQTISYTIDVYRGNVLAQRSFPKFLMYVSMYPQLVAGPIVRYSTVADEIDNRTITSAGMSSGFNLFCIGLAKKVLLANTAGKLAAIYLEGNLSSLAVTEAWFGIIMFSLQLYYDFSGYSDMAIGLARMFGFHYDPNFNYPYISGSITDFWRRWHISLSSFFKDYVYIPLGGNRKHQFFNILVVWCLTGLWHGASWNFVLWGLYYAVLLIIEKLFLLKLLNRFRIPAQIYRMFFVTLGWAIFYFVDIHRLSDFLKALFGIGNHALHNMELNILLVNNIFWIIAALLFCMPIAVKVGNYLKTIEESRFTITINCIRIVVNLGLIVLCTAALVGQSYNPFLYFRF